MAWDETKVRMSVVGDNLQLDEGEPSGYYELASQDLDDGAGAPSYRLFLEVEDVRDESGQILRVEESRERDNRKIKIWVPGARDVTRTLNLRYTVPNALKYFEEHDELYWNVTGTEWEVPIREASAMVELPAGVTGLRATAFTGAYGSSEKEARIDELEHGFYFETMGGKDMWKQMKQNPKVEICFYNNPTEIQNAKEMRVTGEVEFVDDAEIKKQVYEKVKFLDDLAGKSIEPLLEVFRITSGDAHFWTLMDVLKESQIEHVTF